MPLNRVVWLMARFKLSFIFSTRFKYVQKGSKYNKKNKEEIDNDKNCIPFSTISTYTKRMVICTASITFQFERPWALVWPDIFINNMDMQLHNSFHLHPK